MGVPQGSVIGHLLFNIFINDIIKSAKFSFILYADDTTLNSTLDNFGTNPVDMIDFKFVSLIIMHNMQTLKVTQ